MAWTGLSIPLETSANEKVRGDLLKNGHQSWLGMDLDEEKLKEEGYGERKCAKKCIEIPKY